MQQHSGAWSRNSPDYNGLASRMKPACVKARVARKSRGQQCPYGFDSRPEHIKSLLEEILRGIFVFVQHLVTSRAYLCSKQNSMTHKRTKEEFEEAAKTSHRRRMALCPLWKAERQDIDDEGREILPHRQGRTSGCTGHHRPQERSSGKTIQEAQEGSEIRITVV